MHKVGGIIALSAGVLSIFAMIFSFSSGERDIAAAESYLMGGFVVISAIIFLSAIILNTLTRWPGILLVVVSLLAILFNWAGGFVSVCLFFALIGALMSLNLGRVKGQLIQA